MMIFQSSPVPDFSKARRDTPKPYASDVVTHRSFTFGEAMLLDASQVPTWNAGKFLLVGNGVHLGLAMALARAVRDRSVTKWTLYCACGCGCPVRRGVTLATQTCRKRMSRKSQAERDAAPKLVNLEIFAV
jgi:hypothetical protein